MHLIIIVTCNYAMLVQVIFVSNSFLITFAFPLLGVLFYSTIEMHGASAQ